MIKKPLKVGTINLVLTLLFFVLIHLNIGLALQYKLLFQELSHFLEIDSGVI